MMGKRETTNQVREGESARIGDKSKGKMRAGVGVLTLEEGWADGEGREKKKHQWNQADFRSLSLFDHDASTVERKRYRAA